MSTPIAGPTRINKYLALEGYATRKKADELIAAGEVTINGRTAVLGDKVHPCDTVAVHTTGPRTARVYLAYYKPKGIVTHGAQENEREIQDLLHERAPDLDVFPVGRLDKASHGLILLTNDGRIVEPLLSPKRTHEKEYEVVVHERLRKEQLEHMARGVNIGGYTTKPALVEKLTGHSFRIVLTEGKHHQIRRMCDAVQLTVQDLKRVRVINVRVGGLRPGTYRKLHGQELEDLLRALNIKTNRNR